MTPKEKADELFGKFMLDLVGEIGISNEVFELNRKFALIVVDEILDLDSGDSIDKNYWQEVKQEIEKL